MYNAHAQESLQCFLQQSIDWKRQSVNQCTVCSSSRAWLKTHISGCSSLSINTPLPWQWTTSTVVIIFHARRRALSQHYVVAFNFVTMVMVYKCICLSIPVPHYHGNRHQQCMVINSQCKEEGIVTTICCSFQFCYHGITAPIYLYPITMATGHWIIQGRYFTTGSFEFLLKHNPCLNINGILAQDLSWDMANQYKLVTNHVLSLLEKYNYILSFGFTSSRIVLCLLPSVVGRA